MSKKKLKKHRDKHGTKLLCPMCVDFRPGLKSHLIVKVHRYHTYGHDVMWDGATVYLNKAAVSNKKEKVYFELLCSYGCKLNTLFQHESELQTVLAPFIETLFEELISVPPPPKTLPIVAQSKQKEKKYILKLVPRRANEECKLS